MGKVGKGLLAIVLFSSVLFSAKATHLIGAEITWEAHNSDSMKVFLTVYRDCRGINLTNYNILVSSTNYSKVYTAKRTSIKDVTPVCRSQCTRCVSSSCTYSYGVQKISSYAFVHLDSFGTDCELKFSYQEYNRNNGISTGAASQPFYTESMHNRCLAPFDNSPVYNTDPITIAALGQDIIIDGGCTDVDTNSMGFGLDSLSYALTPPLQAPSRATTYTGSYTFQKPLNYFGFPNNRHRPMPRGFHFDSTSGIFAFRPAKLESSIMAYRTYFYRKGKLTGYTTRDAQIIIVRGNNNSPPVLSGMDCSSVIPSNFSTVACANQPVDFTICSTDKNKLDSIELKVYNAFPGAKVTIISGQRPSLRFQWTPTDSHVRSDPYSFVVQAIDNACPIRDMVARVYSITVLSDTVKPIMRIETTGDTLCGDYQMKLKRPLNIPVSEVKWYANDTLWSMDTLMNYSANSARDIPIRMEVKVGHCWHKYYDTLRIAPFKPIKLKAIEDTTVCMPKTIFRLLHGTGGYGNLQYSWGNTAATLIKSDTLRKRFGNLGYTETFWYAATDTASCRRTRSFKVKILPTSTQNLMNDTLFCQDSAVSFQLPLLQKSLGIWSGLVVDSNYIKADTLPNGTYKIRFLYSDSATCLVDSALIRISKKPQLKVWAEQDSLCSRHRSIQLHARPGGGTWWGHKQAPDSIFQSLNSKDTTYPLSYRYVNSLGCSNTAVKDIVIKDYPLPILIGNDSTFCHQSDTLALQATPGGGTWKGSNLLFSQSDSFFLALPNSNLTLNLEYVYEDSLKCFNTQTMVYKQNESIEIVMPKRQILCFGSKNSIKVGKPIPAGGSFTHPKLSTNKNGDYVFKVDSSGIGKNYLRYSITTMAGCTSVDSMVVNIKEPKKLVTLKDTALCEVTSDFYIPMNDSKGNWNKPGSFTRRNDSFFLIPSKIKVGSNEFFYITRDSNGCEARADIRLVAHGFPVVQVMADTHLCAFPAQLLPLQASPAMGQWEGPGISLLADTNFFTSHDSLVGLRNLRYSFVDSNGCKASDSLQVRVWPRPVVNAGLDDTLCADSGIYIFNPITKGGQWLNAEVTQGAQRAEWKMDTSFYGFKEFYYQMVDVRGCMNIDTLHLLKARPVKARFSASSQNGIIPFTVNFSSLATSGTTLLWNFGDGNVSTTVNPSHTYDSSGTFTVSLLATDSASKCRDYVAIDSFITTGFNGFTEPLGPYALYPNPAKESVLLLLPQDCAETRYELYDLHGKLLIESPLYCGTNLIALQGLAKGSYLVKVVSESHVQLHPLVKW